MLRLLFCLFLFFTVGCVSSGYKTHGASDTCCIKQEPNIAWHYFISEHRTVVPSAKQKSFAAYNPADLVMASFSDLPLSAANAFEKPIEMQRPGGYLQPSIKAFDDYISRVYEGYGLNDPKAVFSVWETSLAPKKSTLADIEKWVRADGKEQNGV